MKGSLFSILILCLFALNSSYSFGAESYVILSAQIVIDGIPDADLEEKATVFPLTQTRIGGGTGPYTVYLCYDAENLYFACDGADDDVSCKDDASRDFMDSDYIRFYISVDDDFRGRLALNGTTDWAIIFAPQEADGTWKPMVRECPYSGPGHGAIEGDDIAPRRASGPTDEGWYLEAAIPLSLFDVTYEELNKITFGVYFVAGDTDAGGVRSGEMSMAGEGFGNYWESPGFCQESVLGELLSVGSRGKLSSTWGKIK